MGVFTDQVITTNEFIRESMYSTTSEADGIDLRVEMNWLLYGDGVNKPKGHWVVVRHFNRTEKSKYWNKFSKEGVGGPAHPYTDYLVRSRRMPYPMTDTSDYTKVGDIFSDKFIYWIEYTVNIHAGDQIFELNVVDHKVEPTSYKFDEKYNVKRLHPYRLENGNVQYYAALCELDHIDY